MQTRNEMMLTYEENIREKPTQKRDLRRMGNISVIRQETNCLNKYEIIYLKALNHNEGYNENDQAQEHSRIYSIKQREH